ncbi:MAG: hypothetical protein ACOX6T_23540 [Myxococcales bacterium]|jgi:hypothetical protein
MIGRVLFTLAAAGALALAVSARARAGADSLRPVARGELRVTLGELAQGPAGMLRVEAPKLRALVSDGRPQEAHLRFRYLGPTREDAPLASGELRRQIGLKLREQDGCNLVYVMWRIAPRPDLVVSIKRNPGMSRSTECGAGGYRNLKPERRGALPQLTPGSEHRLSARIDGETLKVEVDGALAWSGRLGAEALELEGPVGLRTDNGRFDIELQVPR